MQMNRVSQTPINNDYNILVLSPPDQQTGYAKQPPQMVVGAGGGLNIGVTAPSSSHSNRSQGRTILRANGLSLLGFDDSAKRRKDISDMVFAEI
jgi:hypothetical protein